MLVAALLVLLVTSAHQPAPVALKPVEPVVAPLQGSLGVLHTTVATQNASSHAYSQSVPGRIPPGVSYYTQSVSSYTGLTAYANISDLSIGGDEWFNGSKNGAGEAAIRLSGVVYSSKAGVFEAVFAALLTQWGPNSYYLVFQDQVWNESSTCSGPGTYDAVSSVSGNGSVSQAFPGCFGTRYQFTVSTATPVSAPFSLGLTEKIVPVEGALGIAFNYSVRSAGTTEKGVNDVVTVYPGDQRVSAGFRVGGLTPLAFNYDMELVLAAPLPEETVRINASSGVLALYYLSGAARGEPQTVYNYGPDALSGSYGATVYTDVSNPNQPLAVLAGGVLHESRLWPLPVFENYTVSQYPPGGAVTLSAHFYYLDALNASYVSLTDAAVQVYVNGEYASSVRLQSGSADYVFQPDGEGYFNVTVVYPPSVSFGEPTMRATIGFISLRVEGVNAASQPVSVSETLPNGSVISLEAPTGESFILIPSGGLTLSASQSPAQAGAAVRQGFYGWVAPNGSIISASPSIHVQEPQSLVAEYSVEYLVVINDTPAGYNNSEQWVNAGGTITLTTPAYVYLGSNLERLAFVDWSTGQTGNATITVDSPLNVSANYKIQYLVYLSTPLVVLMDKYFDNGSTVVVTAPATLGGTLLYPNVFKGWAGTITSQSRTLRLNVTQPYADGAVYGISYARVSAIQAFVAIAAGAAFVFYAQKKKL